MELLLLSLFVILVGVAIAYAGEIYLYLSLVLGSTIRDIHTKIKSLLVKNNMSYKKLEEIISSCTKNYLNL